MGNMRPASWLCNARREKRHAPDKAASSHASLCLSRYLSQLQTSSFSHCTEMCRDGYGTPTCNGKLRALGLFIARVTFG